MKLLRAALALVTAPFVLLGFWAWAEWIEVKTALRDRR